MLTCLLCLSEFLLRVGVVVYLFDFVVMCLRFVCVVVVVVVVLLYFSFMQSCMFICLLN